MNYEITGPDWRFTCSQCGHCGRAFLTYRDAHWAAEHHQEKVHPLGGRDIEVIGKRDVDG